MKYKQIQSFYYMLFFSFVVNSTLCMYSPKMVLWITKSKKNIFESKHKTTQNIFFSLLRKKFDKNEQRISMGCSCILLDVCVGPTGQ